MLNSIDITTLWNERACLQHMSSLDLPEFRIYGAEKLKYNKDFIIVIYTKRVILWICPINHYDLQIFNLSSKEHTRYPTIVPLSVLFST